ncbi:MAG: glycosyltransferase [Calditrichia bacterium]
MGHPFMLLFTISVYFLYMGFIIWLLWGIRRAWRFHSTQAAGEALPFSIVIAAHNEEQVIGETLQRLISQNYPDEKYEIVVVADRCSDRTAQIVEEYQAKVPGLQLISVLEVPPNMAPKKYALQQGIARSQHDHLILMDADCLPGPGYLSTFNKYFNGRAQVVLNFPKVRVENRILHRYLHLERLITWSIAAAGVGHRRPFLAFGGSWGYTREILEKAGGMESVSHSLSGDDDLLIYRMGRLKPVMAVCFDPAGWVQTFLPPTFQHFLRQRRRHHSAGRHYATGVKMGYAFFHLSHFLLWFLPVFFLPAIITLFGKFLLDGLTLHYAGKIFREKVQFKNGILFEIGFLLHHLLIAPLGFIGKIRWK